MFKLEIERLRIDLGDDDFVDCHEALGHGICQAADLKSLSLKFKELIKNRNGQIVESSAEGIVFDTSDCTFYVCLDHSERDVTETEKEELINLL